MLYGETLAVHWHWLSAPKRRFAYGLFIPEDGNNEHYRCENLKFYVIHFANKIVN
jgi:hypothetical protein